MRTLFLICWRNGNEICMWLHMCCSSFIFCVVTPLYCVCTFIHSDGLQGHWSYVIVRQTNSSHTILLLVLISLTCHIWLRYLCCFWCSVKKKRKKGQVGACMHLFLAQTQTYSEWKDIKQQHHRSITSLCLWLYERQQKKLLISKGENLLVGIWCDLFLLIVFCFIFYFIFLSFS